MKRAPFIDMKKRPFEQTFGAEAKENNVPGQKNSSLKSMHNFILSVERFSADGGTDTKKCVCARNGPREKSRRRAKMAATRQVIDRERSRGVNRAEPIGEVGPGISRVHK